MEIITLLREIAPIRKIDEAVEIYAERSVVYADFYSTHQELLDSPLDTVSVDVMVNDVWKCYEDCDQNSLDGDIQRFRYILTVE